MGRTPAAMTARHIVQIVPGGHMKNKILSKYRFQILAVAMFALNLWIACQIPYTHDDWDWGIEIGIQHLTTADINSRYVGNLIEVILTRQVFLKDLVMGAVFTLIPLALTELAMALSDPGRESGHAGTLRICFFAFAEFMLLAIPPVVWCQTNGWVAGFSNFVVSGLGLLLFYLLIARTYRREPGALGGKRAGGFLSCLLIALFGAAIQLFLENLSVYFLLCALLFAAFSWRRDRQSLRVALSLLAGTAVGFFVMFSSNIYESLWNTGYAIDEYRQLMFDRSKPLYVFLFEAGGRYVGSFAPKIVGVHGLLTSAVSVLFLLKAVSELKRGASGRKPRVLNSLLAAAHVFYAAFFLYGYFRLNYFGGLNGLVRIAVTAFDLLFAVLVLFDIFHFFRADKTRLFLLCALWISPFLILAPMVLINTTGPRSYYTGFLCLILFCQLLMGCLLEASAEGLRKAVRLGLLALLLIACVNMARVYYPIGSVNRQRLAMIRQAREGRLETVDLPDFPHEEYLWNPDPIDAEREAYYRAFYDLPEDVALIYKLREAEG